MGEEIRQFRSRLNSLPFEMKMKIGEIPYQIGMRATSRKNKVIEILREYNIDFTELGTGTNRFIVRYDGYAMKIALDMEGVADNKQEWVMSDVLAPDVATAFEISKGGHLLMATYAPAFTSYSEMNVHRQTIEKILGKWDTKFLLGDVGINRVNYANWGMGPNGKPVCIDYAYIFPASMDLFKCICGSKHMISDSTFSSYRCAECGRQYEDRDLRIKISQDDRLRLFSNVAGIEMKDEFEDHLVDIKYDKKELSPDMPDPDEIAKDVASHMLGQEGLWYNGGMV